MAGGRGIAIVAMALTLFLLLSSKTIHAATFKVGDDGGWRFSVNTWPNGKTFKAGDVLEFVYGVGVHNVAVVDKNGHDTCTAASSDPVFVSGDDKITLKQGENYFICTVGGHCDAGMNLAINAQ